MRLYWPLGLGLRQWLGFIGARVSLGQMFHPRCTCQMFHPRCTCQINALNHRHKPVSQLCEELSGHFGVAPAWHLCMPSLPGIGTIGTVNDPALSLISLSCKVKVNANLYFSPPRGEVPLLVHR